MIESNGHVKATVLRSREWRGNHESWVSSHRRYEFPVAVRKADEGAREAPNS
ncbi:hypothetical protein IPZ58_05065 [Streptomyces roseoverticillatus]|uniref:hypothetical protein n=1 Tax=Streptomyces roseoverticillatus TaxID=66429 RepID=UPI001F22BFE8|nr:hypothetical protein [Streptomyces roseoverticillatus]MCF3100945.1 hypothetical protein [Streptomyces roseoverticillatus]